MVTTFQPNTVDQKCQELAEYFLRENPRLKGEVKALAIEIQFSIENWLDSMRQGSSGD